jgi:acyl carrier protein
VLSKMELQDFKISTGPKRIGTANLLTALVDQPLEFFLMLSSISSVVGTIAQGSYAAANNYMDTIAYNNKVSGASCTHFAAIDFGPIDDAGVIVDSQRTKDGLIRQGYILIKLKELLALVRYAISHTAKDEKSNQFVLGIDYKSILDSDNKYTLRNPMFAHLSRRSKGGLEVEASESKNQSFEELVSGTDDSNKITDLISEAITIKISKLVAIDSEEIDVERNMGDFGIDSLVSIEMKNWITQTFKAKLQASEISEADNILALAALVASRSAIISQKHEAATEKKNEKEQPNRIQNGNVNGIHAEHHSPKDEKEVAALPKQPLPELDQSLYQFLDRLLPILTPKEYMKYESYVEGFRKQGGFGRKLQARLSKLSHDPRVENWLGEFYTTNMFLKSRRTLVPWSNFFATHLVSPFQHTVAERAAIISVAAFQFKQDLEQGKVAQQFFNDQATCSSAYKWFFNATREPGEHVDAMRKYPGNDYLVAFRRGHAYRIPLSHGNEPVSFAALRETFQHIIDTNGKAESWVGLLTQDGRDSWAHVSFLTLR